jgi:hypothetical protein
MRILLVSQMYPGPSAPDLGVFVQQIADELEQAGNEVARVVIDQRGGSPAKYGGLAARALAEARRFHPDVVYAHFLFPAGAAAAFAARRVGARLVLTAHGRDVRNVGRSPGVATATRAAIRRADAVIAVSDFLPRELEAKVPEARARCTSSTRASTLRVSATGSRRRCAQSSAGRAEHASTSASGRWTSGRTSSGSRTHSPRWTRAASSFAGDGPLRPARGPRARRLLGRVAHAAVADLIAASDVVCQPSLIEPFGQVVLEALASSARWSPRASAARRARHS